ncbi:hypothetical protein AURDEDRAFT_178768 [Auricularia subglabra TFB-10046 SS5]|uniref:Uncharacterized protein n=1 Tax=Auricularia subglabra (strain TFB-10046 / SS5) TaxID=717982 RepID=J0WKB8_AURST|nr:hypothetical protein AURDEDRAFT_178768 [Auricularia subglabra TFB-10046 SS5]
MGISALLNEPSGAVRDASVPVDVYNDHQGSGPHLLQGRTSATDGHGRSSSSREVLPSGYSGAWASEDERSAARSEGCRLRPGGRRPLTQESAVSAAAGPHVAALAACARESRPLCPPAVATALA